MKQEITQEAVKAAPPLAVTTAHAMFGFSLSDWLIIVTIGYTVLLGLHLIWKWIKEWRRK